MPHLCGHEVILRVQKEVPETGIVVFTGARDTSVVARRMMKPFQSLERELAALGHLLSAIGNAPRMPSRPFLAEPVSK